MNYSHLLQSLWLVAYGILVSGFLSGCFLCIWFAWRTLRKESYPLSSGGAESQETMKVLPPGKLTAAQAGKMLLLTILMGIAYAAGDQQATSRFERSRFTYNDVLVVARHDERNFTLQPARMAPWEATTCQPVDWQRGQKMIAITYKQRDGCKDVGAAGAFEFYSEHGKRNLYQEEIANVGY